MIRALWLAVYGGLLVALILQFVDTVHYIAAFKPRILTTPFQLALIPLTFNIPQDLLYLRPFAGSSASLAELKHLQALLPIYAASLFFWITGIILYIFTRVRRLERAYILFCAFVTAYFLLFVDYFTRRYTGSFFLAYNIIVIASFLYLFRSVYQLESHAWFYPLIFGVGLSLYFIVPVRSAADEILLIEILGGIFFVTFLYCTYLFIQAELHKGAVANRRFVWAGRVFNLSLIFAVALPPGFFFLLYYLPVHIDINYNALFFLPALFPIIFLTLSLRWGLVSFHVPISLFGVRVLYFAFFGFLYWFTIGFSLGEISQSENVRLGHIWILALFLFLIDPLRTALMSFLDSYTSARRKILDSFLLQSSQQIANPRRVNHFIDRIAASLTEGLGTSWAKIVISRDVFLNWEAESDKVIYLPADDPFWTQTRGLLRRSRYPVLTRTFIGPVRDFLQGHGGFLAILMNKYKGAILIPERRENMPYFNEDVRFLRQIAHEAEILIQNYIFLIENVKLKRRERELADNARIQRKIIPGFREFERFSFWSYSRAYESVTGDYLDLIEVSADKFFVLLGDVSGHGISSGYLVAFARAFVRGALVDRRQTLAEAFAGLNAYLAENYRGNEFITLFALQLQFSDAGMYLSYINAGQHPALIYQAGELTQLHESQRLLGVTQNTYTEISLRLQKSPTRIILFSDGAFDVFNKSGKLLGQKKFYDWVETSLDRAPGEQLAFLRQRIEAYTGSGDESDDLALVVIETK